MSYSKLLLENILLKTGILNSEPYRYLSNNKQYILDCLYSKQLEIDMDKGVGYIDFYQIEPLRDSFFEPDYSKSVEHQLASIENNFNWYKLSRLVKSLVYILDGYFGGKPISVKFKNLDSLLCRFGITLGSNSLCLMFLDDLFFEISFSLFQANSTLSEFYSFPKYANINYLLKLINGINKRHIEYRLSDRYSSYCVKYPHIFPYVTNLEDLLNKDVTNEYVFSKLYVEYMDFKKEAIPTLPACMLSLGPSTLEANSILKTINYWSDSFLYEDFTTFSETIPAEPDYDDLLKSMNTTIPPSIKESY